MKLTVSTRESGWYTSLLLQSHRVSVDFFAARTLRWRANCSCSVRCAHKLTGCHQCHMAAARWTWSDYPLAPKLFPTSRNSAGSTSKLLCLCKSSKTWSPRLIYSKSQLWLKEQLRLFQLRQCWFKGFSFDKKVNFYVLKFRSILEASLVEVSTDILWNCPVQLYHMTMGTCFQINLKKKQKRRPSSETEDCSDSSSGQVDLAHWYSEGFCSGWHIRPSEFGVSCIISCSTTFRLKV